MPIAKGSPYGDPGPLPEGAVIVATDAAAAEALEAARGAGRPYPVLGLVGGDLCRTLGGGTEDPAAAEARLRSEGGVRFPVDVGEALLDGRRCLFVAHLVARTPGWRQAFVAMNAQWLGRGRRRAWNLGPRAHPGDGRLDCYEAELPVAQVLAVAARLHHGGHLPHPGIGERRVAAHEVSFARPRPVWADGRRVGTAARIVVRAAPDAVSVVV